MRLAYVAGIFDGEGCVNFGRTRRTSFIRASIVNTYLPLLEALKARFGGDIAPRRRRGGWKRSYEWRIQWTRAVDFLDAISPWLIVKGRQAAVAFAWNAIRRGRGWHRAGPGRDHGDAVELLRAQLRWLNNKGHGAQCGPEPIDIALSTQRAAKAKGKHR